MKCNFIYFFINHLISAINFHLARGENLILLDLESLLLTTEYICHILTLEVATVSTLQFTAKWF